VASDKTYALEQRLNALVTKVNAIKSALLPIINAGNASFLSGLSELPHQTTNNLLDTNTGPYWITGERSYQADLATAVNNLQSNLQGHGYQA
jgi:hypothetical protein